MHRFVTAPVIAVVSLVLLAGELAADSLFDLEITPEATLPVGDLNQRYYTFGGGGALAATVDGRRREWLSTQLELGYSLAPIREDATLSLVRLTAGVRAALTVSERLSLHAFANGGGFLGVVDGFADAQGFGGVVRFGTGMSLGLTDRTGLIGGAALVSYPGLYEALSAFLGMSFAVERPGSSAEPDTPTVQPLPAITSEPEPGWTRVGDLELGNIEIGQMFPVMFKYYDESPLGRVTVRNPTEVPIRNLEVLFDAERIIDNPKLSASIAELPPGGEQTVDIYALFNDQVLTFTEGTRLAASIQLRYDLGETRRAEALTVTLTTYDRNALRWDDDRKVAAFVTARDPEIQRIARNLAALIEREGVQAVQSELQLAMAQFAFMQERGVAYVVDPSSAYEELSENPLAVDFVQFPRQTLLFQAGDCDDLSVTYAALLQAVGVDTAFVTIPGHLFIAFRLNLSEADARRSFANHRDLIFRDDGSVWIPVETTILNRGFLEAWATGARQWREHHPRGEAGFYRTSEAWAVYEPVAFSVENVPVPVPEAQAVAARFASELNRFVSQEIFLQEESILARLEERPRDLNLLNRLGVLYARYGRLDDARDRFLAVVAIEPFAPALANLGNIAFLEGDLDSAEQYYAAALAADSRSETAILGQARVAHRREDFQLAGDRYEALAALAPAVAERFSYLNPRSDAADARAGAAAQLSRVVLWEETE